MRRTLTIAIAFSVGLGGAGPGCSGRIGGGNGAGADAAGGGADAPGGTIADAAPTPPDGPSPLAAVCAPTITYVNSTASGDGALFDQHVPDVQAYFAARSLEVCTVLYKQPSEVPPRPTLKFVVEDMDGVAY